jgi:hypothetical protein
MYWMKECCFSDPEYAGFDDDGEMDVSRSPEHDTEPIYISKVRSIDPYSSRRSTAPQSHNSGRVSANRSSPVQKSLTETRVSQSATNEENIRLAVEGSKLAKSILADADESEYELTPISSKDLMYPKQSEYDVEEEESISHRNSSTSQRTYITGHACVYPDDHTPMTLTPVQNSSALLDTLTREPQKLDQPLRKLGREENRLCCGSNPYGSWHRSPAIFSDDYDGESSFDLTKTTAMSRRKGGGQGGCLDATKVASILR